MRGRPRPGVSPDGRRTARPGRRTRTASRSPGPGRLAPRRTERPPGGAIREGSGSRRHCSSRRGAAARSRLRSCPERGAFRRYAWPMALREDPVALRIGDPDRRTMLQAAGFTLAIVATLAGFLTENPQVLRLAVVGVAWAFVLATFAAGRRSADRAAAGARENALRQAYDVELEREVAARREYELELEATLRREAEESMRATLDGLRDDLTGLTELRAEVAALSSLRSELPRIAALREDVAALTSLRQELGQLAELRADLGRLRAELTEQLSSEMLIERIVMRTQASRVSGEPHDAPGRSLDGAARWSDGVPPRELTGGWPALRLDEPRETRQFEQVHVDRAASQPPVPSSPTPAPPVPSSPRSWRPSRESGPAAPRPWETPATASWESLSAPEAPHPERGTASAPVADETPPWSPTLETEGQHAHRGTAEPAPPTSFPTASPPGGPRPSAPPPQVAPRPVPEPLPSPAEWLAARSLIGVEPTSSRPDVPAHHRHGDAAPGDPAGAAALHRAAVPAHPPIRVDDRGSYRVAVREESPAETTGSPAQEKRLADILAENGVSPATGGRRRRRYRDDDESDDVLARVLGNS